jgi:hypothetical protein
MDTAVQLYSSAIQRYLFNSFWITFLSTFMTVVVRWLIACLTDVSWIPRSRAYKFAEIRSQPPVTYNCWQLAYSALWHQPVFPHSTNFIWHKKERNSRKLPPGRSSSDYSSCKRCQRCTFTGRLQAFFMLLRDKMSDVFSCYKRIILLRTTGLCSLKCFFGNNYTIYICVEFSF